MSLKEEQRPGNTGLAKVAVQCSADTFVVKIATFAKPETVIANFKKPTIQIKPFIKKIVR
jgi:hypothetical protein